MSTKWASWARLPSAQHSGVLYHPFGTLYILHWDVVSLFVRRLLSLCDEIYRPQGLQSCLPPEFPIPGLALDFEEMLQKAWQC